MEKRYKLTIIGFLVLGVSVALNVFYDTGRADFISVVLFVVGVSLVAVGLFAKNKNNKTLNH